MLEKNKKNNATTIAKKTVTEYIKNPFLFSKAKKQKRNKFGIWEEPQKAKKTKQIMQQYFQRTKNIKKIKQGEIITNWNETVVKLDPSLAGKSKIIKFSDGTISIQPSDKITGLQIKLLQKQIISVIKQNDELQDIKQLKILPPK